MRGDLSPVCDVGCIGDKRIVTSCGGRWASLVAGSSGNSWRRLGVRRWSSFRSSFGSSFLGDLGLHDLLSFATNRLRGRLDKASGLSSSSASTARHSSGAGCDGSARTHNGDGLGHLLLALGRRRRGLRRWLRQGIDLVLWESEIVCRLPNVALAVGPEDLHVLKSVHDDGVSLAQLRLVQPLVVGDDADSQDAPEPLVLLGPGWALKDDVEAGGHELSHDDSKCADHPLVGFVVHVDQRQADSVLKAIEVGVSEARKLLDDLRRCLLDTFEGKVHHWTAENGSASDVVGNVVRDALRFQRLLGVIMTQRVL